MPSFIRELLSAPPRAGEGVHNWLFRVARQLHIHMPAGEIVNLLESRVAGCGRAVSRAEIISAVQNSLPCAWQPQGTAAPVQSAAKWPVINQEQRKSILRDGYGLADLWELSKPRIEDNAVHTEAIVDKLFPGNPLLCCGESSQKFDTRPREAWRGGLAHLQFIVPSPMTRPTGVTKEGKKSAHCLDNSGPRRYLVCEFDTGTLDDHAALLLHLGTYAPMVCAVHSGARSLHGWFFVHGQPEAKVEMFFRYAVSLGADRATWTRSQFVRMPDGTRDNRKRQTVFFLNYNVFKNE